MWRRMCGMLIKVLSHCWWIIIWIDATDLTKRGIEFNDDLYFSHSSTFERREAKVTQHRAHPFVRSSVCSSHHRNFSSPKVTLKKSICYRASMVSFRKRLAIVGILCRNSAQWSTVWHYSNEFQSVWSFERNPYSNVISANDTRFESGHLDVHVADNEPASLSLLLLV